MTGHDQLVDAGKPVWARRIRAERLARNWSQPDAIRALRAHSDDALPSDETLRRNWKRWEAGDAEPDEFYKPLIARTFGTVTNSLFPRSLSVSSTILARTGMDTLEIVSRLRTSDVSAGVLDALRITADQLCSEYPYMAPDQLCLEGRQWLRRVTQLLDQRLTLDQHREVLVLAGWIALLVGCVEYDLGDRMAAEATRKSALSLGSESGNSEIVGWAHEMQAWYALTQGDYRRTVQASDAGQAAAPAHGVSVQLAGQKAKAWARIGDRRQVEVALDEGRRLLEKMPYPENLDHHFVVDPAKFDFYAMDCYRLLGEDRLAEMYARQVIETGTRFDGTESSPMRNAEARVTLGVVAARQGDLDQAVEFGNSALGGERKSIPSLIMCSSELVRMLSDRKADSGDAASYIDRIRALATTSAG
jgi:tetratricopeptide (TPR) repeat protein